jgi:histidine ammonia-lyase
MSGTDANAVVVVDDESVRADDVVNVADGSEVVLGPGALARIRSSRAVVDAALASGRPVYGLNTGVGHSKDVRLPDDALRTMQRMLLMTHSGGVGDSAPTEVVRAAMFVRLVGMSRGGSGASPGAAAVLVDMLNAGVHPVVPIDGSVGAGDLGQMACIGLVAIGMGRAEFKGEVLAGGEALSRAGIRPFELQPKDGLTLMSANGISIGRGALVLRRAANAAAAADVVAALSLEALRGNPSITLPAVGIAKPYPGQIEACRSMRAALEGSFLLEPDAPRSIQDPLSLRVAPQVHGAYREAIDHARRAVEIELNSMSDNPLVSIEEGAMIHNGNFHPMVLAIGFDWLRVAIAHVGQLSDRRMAHLWNAFFENLEKVGPDAAAGSLGLSLRYPSAGIYAELRHLAGPVSLDVPVMDMGVEDHASGAPLTVKKTDEALDALESLLTIEMLMARDVLVSAPGTRALGARTGAMLAAVNGTAATLGGAGPAEIHRAMRSAVLSAFGSDAAKG